MSVDHEAARLWLVLIGGWLFAIIQTFRLRKFKVPAKGANRAEDAASSAVAEAVRAFHAEYKWEPVVLSGQEDQQDEE